MSLKDTNDTLRPLAYRVNDAAKVIGLGRSTLYEMMKEGTLRFVKRGNRRLIPADALMALLGQQDCAA
ncbi:helix-turn-helix domain-containing protein [Rhodoblastus sp.]|uniref:helix-turn-helix domain-containing protein n=1 Tax=Rhodoblastus sp. TaxID=1962975 RepID=UPI003F9BD1D4